MIKPVRWSGGQLHLLDQRKLPHSEEWVCCENVRQVSDAIREMVVRGAPAIGITAAYGMALAAQESFQQAESTSSNGSLRGGVDPKSQSYMDHLITAGSLLKRSRPTAVNLQWAVRTMLNKASQMISNNASGDEIRKGLASEAQALHEADVENNRRLGRHGAQLLKKGDRILTHCNAGALATGGFGTALGVVRSAHELQMNVSVYATETRPYLQGARLTAWELVRDGIPVSLIVDSAAGHLLRCGLVDAVVVGADRIAANGDTANKIGTYHLALAAAENSVPFYVAAPTSTLDIELPDGAGIEIEKREDNEVREIKGQQITPDMVRVENYAFDITPAKLITAVITEHGVVKPPFVKGLKKIHNASADQGFDDAECREGDTHA